MPSWSCATAKARGSEILIGSRIEDPGRSEILEEPIGALSTGHCAAIRHLREPLLTSVNYGPEISQVLGFFEFEVSLFQGSTGVTV